MFALDETEISPCSAIWELLLSFQNIPAVIADVALLAGSIALVNIYFCDITSQYITYVMLAIVSLSLNMHVLFNGRIYKTTKYKRTRRVENHE